MPASPREIFSRLPASDNVHQFLASHRSFGLHFAKKNSFGRETSILRRISYNIGYFFSI